MAAVLPFFTVLAEPGAIQHHPGLRFLYQHIHFSSEHRFILALGVGFALLVVLTNAVNLLGTLAMHRFAFQVGDGLQTALFEDYLNRSYGFHLQTRSATLTSRVTFETGRVTAGILQQGLVLVTSLVSVAFILGSMVLLDPLVALLAILGLGAGYAAAYLGARARLKRNGRAESDAYDLRTRIVNESFAGIKEVILLKAQGAFVGRFARCCHTISRTVVANQAISQTPRYLLEGATACVLAGVALYLSGRPQTAGPWIAQLGFMGFAVYRLLPALHQLFAAIVRMRADRETFESLAADLKRARGRTTATPAKGSPWQARPRGEILLRDVGFRHATASRPAVAGLDLHIPAGAVVGLIGNNGSGKTTLLDLICGLLVPQSGTVVVDGVELDEHNRGAWQSNIAYVPQQIFVLDATVTENVAFGVPREQIDRERVRAVVQMAQLADCVAGLPGGYDEPLGELGARLSWGQRQRLGIARALYRLAPVIILDEATSALDVTAEREIIDALIRHRHSATVVLVAHRAGCLRHCDAIHELSGGQIIRQTTFGQLLKETEECAS
jgi:ABC-type bacteriocin/lantibiotic exporter with double-glycine peptidase domain